MQASEPKQRTRELEQRQEVGGMFVVADEQRPALGEPRQRALHHPAPRGEALFSGRQIELFLPDAAQMRDVVMTCDGGSAGRVVVAQVQTQVVRSLQGRTR